MGILRKLVSINFSHHLKSSTLVEAIVALALLIIISNFIFLIANNVNKGSNVGLNARAYNEVRNIFYFSIEEEDFTEMNFDFKSFKVTRTAEISFWSDDLIVLNVSAYNSRGKLIVCKQRLMLNRGSNEYATKKH